MSPGQPLEELTNSSSAVSPPANVAAQPGDNSGSTLSKAAKLFENGDPDAALDTVNAYIRDNPKSLNGYILRGAINAQKQLWSQATSDYQTALQLSPNDDGVRYDLADLKFRQKQFDDARAAFVPLQDKLGAEVGDLIKYKIFLCDLLAGHDDVAAKELAVFNQAAMNPSYYFGNAAWDLVHKKPEDARGWLVSATNIYPPRKHLLYVSMLKDMGYLPLPPAPHGP
ncbi:MAG: tetratricopeptide repeat protein [Methylacidiphilales bacterium]|nr:tetratricopeptide repeat protein [Candidatus Methylacidiphilales bacterium]